VKIKAWMEKGFADQSLEQDFSWLGILMRAEPVWVARSHEFDQEHEGVRDEHKNTMNTRTNNPIQSGLFSTARTTVPIEFSRKRHKVEAPRERSTNQIITI
jgi:hypothetical protein